MSDNIVAENRVTVEIKIVRGGHQYWKYLTRDGVILDNHVPIDRSLAHSIYSQWKDGGKTHQINQVTFDDIRPADWEWSVKATVEVML